MIAAEPRKRIVLAGGWAVSVAGDYAALVVLTIAVHDRTGANSWAVAAVLGALLAGTILAAPLAGRLVDTLHPARLAVTVALAQALVAGTAAIIGLTVPAILAVALLFGVGTAISRAAVFVLVPWLATRAETGKLNTRIQLGQYLGIAVGQATGGILVASLGVGGALAVDAISFLVFAGLYRTLASLTRPTAPASPAGTSGGLRTLTASPVLLVALVVSAAVALFGSISNVVEVFLAKDVLGAGDSGFGALAAAWTIGVLVGLVFLAVRLDDSKLLRALLVAAGCAGMAIIVTGSAAIIAVACLGYVVGGMANAVAQVAVRTLLHLEVPPERHGRTFATFGAALDGATLCAMAAGGALVGLVGARDTMLIAGTGMIAVTAAAAALLAARARATR